MVKPSQFILNTDYATLKNDATGSFSFVIPASIVIPAFDYYTASYNLTIGTAGAPARTFINSSQSPTLWFLGANLQIQIDGVDSISGPVVYGCFIYISRSASNVVTATVVIYNTNGVGNLTTESTARTITIKVNTFLPPFAS